MSKGVNETILNDTGAVKATITLGANGVGEVNTEAYDAFLVGQGLDMDALKKAQDIRDHAIAVSTNALGEVGIEAMKANKDLQQVSCEFPIGNDVIVATMQRTKEVPNGKDGGRISKHGVVRTGYAIPGTENRGQFKKVRERLSEMATKELAL